MLSRICGGQGRSHFRYGARFQARPHNEEGGNDKQTYQGKAKQPKHVTRPGQN